MDSWTLTSESVTEGHPDKVCDAVSDTVLDTILAADPQGRVACEALVKSDLLVVAGEITTSADYDAEAIARSVLHKIGYTDEALGIDAATCRVITQIVPQSKDVAVGLETAYERRLGGGSDADDNQGAGDQGMMFGYACDETPDLMPLPIWLAHRLARQLAQVRKDGVLPYLRPDGKTQVSVRYEGQRPTRVETVVVSAQHDPAVDSEQEIKPDLIREVIVPVVPEELRDETLRVIVNPTGVFAIGGPEADTGLTGRKIIIDTYGGAARHGGGAFSGKDPSKTDRCGAYGARWVAKNVVASGAATRCEVQVSYAIGVARPISLLVETFGTERADPRKIAAVARDLFDLRPLAIIRDLDLLRPIYADIAAYGHFGRAADPYTWEATNRVSELRSALNL
jgi:S-adenosylmethionine synthetase